MPTLPSKQKTTHTSRQWGKRKETSGRKYKKATKRTIFPAYALLDISLLKEFRSLTYLLLFTASKANKHYLPVTDEEAVLGLPLDDTEKPRDLHKPPWYA